MSNSNTYIIINPASAGGKTGNRAGQILNTFVNIFGCNFTLLETQKPLDAEAYTKIALSNGAGLIVCVGGDGTINEVVNGFYSNGKITNVNCRLGIVSSGTGQGFAQSIGLPQNLDEQIRIIKKDTYKVIDIGKISLNDPNGIKTRYFVNEFQAGIGGAVVESTGNESKRLGGFLAFGITTVKTAIKHPNQYITLITGDGRKITKKFTGLVFANGEFTGGGMNLVPNANPNDGLLDVLLMHSQSRIERLKNFTKIYSGTHIKSPKFEILRGNEFDLTSEDKVLIEADGELLGYLPCKVTLLPSQIRVCN